MFTWISKRTAAWAGQAPRDRALGAFALSFGFGFLLELARVRLGIVVEPHPAWIAALLLSARKGHAGFCLGVPAAALAIVAGDALGGEAPLATMRHLQSGPDLAALGAGLAVSWVGAWHLRREDGLRERVRTLSNRASIDRSTIEALREAVATLRKRVDRASSSLSFQRDIAARLHGPDPVAAAQAVADLALARSGARAAAVHVRAGNSKRLLATRDARGSGALGPPDHDQPDWSVPIGSGPRIGSITLWGIPEAGLDRATQHDLTIIASWCMPALTSVAWGPDRIESASGGER